MNKSYRIIGVILAIVFFGYFLYSERQQHVTFREQLEEIKEVRKAMEDSLRVIKQKTEKRDKELRDLIRRDMEIIDTLNVTLSKLNKSSKVIEAKIDQNKKAIDRLWNAN